MRELPQGRYVHLSDAHAVLALRPERDPRPALEQANLPLLGWDYLDDDRVKLSFAGKCRCGFRSRQRRCSLEVAGRRHVGVKVQGVWQFELAETRVSDAQLLCH